jgi:hypothetical protein
MVLLEKQIILSISMVFSSIQLIWPAENLPE